jgi:hypothetical protein
MAPNLFMTKRNYQSSLPMKTIKTAFFILIVSLLAFACDKVDQPYVNLPAVIDTAACPVPDFPLITNHVKHVLLEDYTGHTCPNCPTAGKIARDLKEQYPGQVVVIAVHAGWFANTYPEPGATKLFDYDFRTPAGTDWDTFFKISAAGNPNGMVNRVKVNDKYVIKKESWGSIIDTMVTGQPSMDLQVIADYDASDRKVCVHTQSSFLTDLDENLKLEVVITEDSIIAAQKNNDPAIGPVGDIEDFVHMHVMRGTFNGTWGSELASEGVSHPDNIIKSFQSTLPEKCNARNCHIVAFVFNKDTYEVLQVAETKLIE